MAICDLYITEVPNEIGTAVMPGTVFGLVDSVMSTLNMECNAETMRVVTVGISCAVLVIVAIVVILFRELVRRILRLAVL